jgi:hypothetical protein
MTPKSSAPAAPRSAPAAGTALLLLGLPWKPRSAARLGGRHCSRRTSRSAREAPDRTCAICCIRRAQGSNAYIRSAQQPKGLRCSQQSPAHSACHRSTQLTQKGQAVTSQVGILYSADNRRTREAHLMTTPYLPVSATHTLSRTPVASRRPQLPPAQQHFRQQHPPPLLQAVLLSLQDTQPGPKQHQCRPTAGPVQMAQSWVQEMVHI